LPTVTKIQAQRRRANRRNVFLDGTFAFGCNLNVIARFRLREGLELSADEIRQIQRGEVRQECFDSAMRYLESRLHSRTELKRKLVRKEFGPAIIDGVLDDLQRMNYLDDARFASAKAASAAKHKHHGPRRAMMELVKAGVPSTLAKQATAQVYESRADTLAIAMKLAERQAPRLKRLDPQVAKRRLTGMLLRRGFDFESIKRVIAKVLGTKVPDSEALDSDWVDD
jgi:regulatory protein